MRLYKTYHRLGRRLSTLREPPVAPDTSPEFEEAMAVNWPAFWEFRLKWPDGSAVSYDDHYAILWHYIRLGVFTYGLRGAALKLYVKDQVAVWVLKGGWSIAGGVAVVYGVIMLAFYIWDPPLERIWWEDDYGTKWIMRYENRCWWAKWTGFFEYDMPIFEQLDEIGEVISTEQLAVVRPGIGVDRWWHLKSWVEVKETELGWHQYIWQVSFNKFQGFCTQVERGYYGVRKEYHAFMVPVSEWGF